MMIFLSVITDLPPTPLEDARHYTDLRLIRSPRRHGQAICRGIMPRALAILRFMISSTFVTCSTGKSRRGTAMLKIAYRWRNLRRPAQPMSICLPRAQPAVERSPTLPGDTYLSFSLFALGVSDFAAVCPRQLAVQSASAARQPFGTA